MSKEDSISNRLAREMADGTADLSRKPLQNNIPTPAENVASLTKTVKAIKTVLDTMTGSGGSVLDKALTPRDMLDEGMLLYAPSTGLTNTGSITTTVGSGGGSSGGGGGYTDPRPVFTTPPTPTNLQAFGAFKNIVVSWDLVDYRNHAYTEVWRNTVDNLATATLLDQTSATTISDASGTLGSTYYYWVRAVNFEGVPGAYNASAGVSAGLLKIGTTDLGPLVVEAGNLANGAVTGTKLAASSIDATKFANTIEPVTVVTSVPGTKSTNTIFNTTDGKLYRWNGTAYVASVAAVDLSGTITNSQIADLAAGKITGQLSNSQIADIAAAKITGTVTASQIAAAAIDVTKFASGLEPITVVSSVPGTKSTNTIFNTTDGKMYRWNGTAYVASVPAADVSGQLTNSQIADLAAAKLTGTISTAQLADGAISSVKFASGIEPITIVSSVPGAKSTNSIFNTTDGKLYRWNGTAYVSTVPTSDLSGTVSDAQIAGMAASKVTGQLTDSQLEGISAAKLTGSITSTQITDGAISTPKLAAGAVTASEISAGAITTAKLAAGAVTATELAAGAVTTAKIAAGAVTASTIAANTITAGQIASNTITASQLAANTITAGQIAAGAISTTQLAANSVTASKLVLGDFSNVLPGGDMITASDWALQSGTAPTWVAAPTTDWNTPFVARLDGAGASYTIIISKVFPVEPGAQLFAAFQGQVLAGTGSMFMQIQVASDEAITTPTYLSVGSVTATSVTRVTATVTVPTGLRYARVQLVKSNNGITSGYIGAPIVRVAGRAELIVDGAITAGKVAAGAITTAKLAAGAVTANEIAANAVTATQIAAGAITTAKLAAGAVTANELAANSVVAGKIQAGAITATELAAGSITASKLAVADTTNLFRNPDFAGGSSDGLLLNAGGAIVLASDPSVPTGAPTQYVFRRAVPSATVVDFVGEDWIPAAPGETFYIEGTFAADAGTNGTLAVCMRVADSVLGATQSQVIPTNGSLAPASYTTWTRFGGVVTVPTQIAAGVFPAYVRFYFRSQNNASPVGAWNIARVIARRAANAEMIVDGAITATKVAATAISSDKLTVVARELVNPVTYTGNINGWGAITETGTGTSTYVTYDATERAIAVTTATDGTARSKSFRVDHNKIYRIAVSTKSDVAGGLIYIGVAGFSADTAGLDGTSSGSGTQTFTQYNSSRVAGASTTNPYFQTSLAGATTYSQHVYYLVGANRSVDDCPQHTGTGAAPFIKMPDTTTHAAVRLLNFSNGGTTRVAYFRDVSVTEVGSGQIVASNIVADAITSTKIAAGAVIAGKIATGAVTTDTMTANSINGDRILANSLDAGKITANSITAGQIQAGAIGATQIAAGAVTASKLTVADFSNMCPAGELRDTASWSLNAGITFGAPPDSNWTSQQVATLTGAAASWVIAMDTTTLGVEPGQKYYLGFEGQITGGTGSIRCDLMLSATSDMATPSYLATTAITSTSYTSVGTQLTIPAGFKFARVRFYKNNDGVTSCRVGRIVLRRAASAELIVDGAITANKIAANAIAVGTAAIESGAISRAMIGTAAIDTARIDDLAVTGAKIANATITDAKIFDLSADKITAGSIGVGRYIQSTGYSAGATGFRINGNGSAEFNGNITMRSFIAEGGEIRTAGGATLWNTNGTVQPWVTYNYSTTAGLIPLVGNPGASNTRPLRGIIPAGSLQATVADDAITLNALGSEVYSLQRHADFGPVGTTVLQDVPGMSFQVEAGTTHIVRGTMLVQASGTTNGPNFQLVALSGTPTIVGRHIHQITTATTAERPLGTAHTATSAASTTVIAEIIAAVTATANTTIKLQFASSSASTVTLLAGSTITVSKPANKTITVSGALVNPGAMGTTSPTSAVIRVNTDGTITGGGNWFSIITAGIGAQYEVQFTPGTVTGDGVVVNPASSFTALTAARSISLQAPTSQTWDPEFNVWTPDYTGSVSVTATIREIANTTNTVSFTITLNLSQ